MKRELSQGPTIIEDSRILERFRSKRLAAIAAGVAIAGAGFAEKAFGASANAQSSSSELVQSHANNLYTDATPDALPASNSQKDLNDFGREQVNDIPGFSVDLKQKTLDAHYVDGALETDFACAPATRHNPAPIESIRVFPNHEADVNFCPSDEKIVVSKLNMHSHANKKWLNEYFNDPLRNEEWGGDYYADHVSNLYYEIPLLPSHQDPRTAFKFHRKRKFVGVKYDAGNYSKYGNLVGMYTEEPTVQVKGTEQEHYHTIGSALHIDSLKEGLFAISRNSDRYLRTKVVIPELGKLCRSGKLDMRIKIKERFISNHAQTFVHDSKGGRTPLRSTSHIYKSDSKEVCN